MFGLAFKLIGGSMSGIFRFSIFFTKTGKQLFTKTGVQFKIKV